MTTALWFMDHDRSGFPVEKAAMGGCDLAVAFIGGEWRWLVRCNGGESPKAGCEAIWRRGGWPKRSPGVSWI